jgi:beta-lactamase class A
VTPDLRAAETTVQQLAERLDALCEREPFVTRWWLRELDGNVEAGRDADVVGPSASTRKIAILLAALHQVHEGRWSLDDPLSPDPCYQRDESGCFQHFQPGFTLPLIDHLTMMIIVSDNTSTGMLVDMLGLERLNAYSRAAGMANTTHRDGIPSPTLTWDHPPDATNATTPRDVGQLLGRILAGSDDKRAARELGLTPVFCRRALDILLAQRIDNLMRYQLPPTARIANKTGTGVRDHADAGIVFADEEPRFIFAAFCDYVPPVLPDGRAGKGAAQLHIARLSRVCWDALAISSPPSSARPGSFPPPSSPRGGS